jgi:sensor histidine kinase YesM
MPKVPASTPLMVWIAYAAVWLTFALVWALAGAASSGTSVAAALPFALMAMGSAAVMGIGIWRITATLPPDWRSARFYITHATGLAVFCVVYATSWIWFDVFEGRFFIAVEQLRRSPVLLWNILMGIWLYLMIAASAYAIRGHQRLRAQEAAAAEARLLTERAQLAALRAQVNPHFLFNALHSIGALVTINPALADRALERLGDMLRYALNADDEVLLSQEWRFTSDYIALEELRLGDRLRVHAHVDDRAVSVLVPPLILQPLVENAVRHGIANRPQGGELHITARIDGDELRLEVADDGCGAGDGSGNGFGLESVRRRLAALYGERASVRIERARPGFAVSIAVPAGVE